MKSESTPTPSGSENNNKKPASGRRFIFTVIKTVIISLVTLFCVAAGIIGGAIAGYINTAEPIKDEQLVLAFNKTTFIYDDKGNVISKLTGKDNRDSEPVSEKQAPKFLKDAIIAIEDERFETHSGIDLKGIINVGFSLIKNIITDNVDATRGGSTITQQVVKNITGNTRRSLERKVQEWYAAIQLEKKYSKGQILELYMNICYWGHSCYGVQSASKKYFGKDVWDLSLAQCALLAGITNNPGTYDPFTETGRAKAKERQETILKKMLDLGKIDQRQYEQILKEDLKYTSPNEEAEKAASVQSYFVDQAITAYLKKVGIDKSDEKWISLALGGLYKGVNPLQMAAAYVPFAHKGMYYEPATFTVVKDSKEKVLIDKKPKYEAVYSEQTAFLMEDMMKGNNRLDNIFWNFCLYCMCWEKDIILIIYINLDMII